MRKALAAVVFGMLSATSCSPISPYIGKEDSLRADRVEPTRYIRTRVYVESVVIKTEIPEVRFVDLGNILKPQQSNLVLLTVPARAPSEIINDFKVAEKKLESLKIRFCIEDIVFFPSHKDPINNEIDLSNYKDDQFPAKNDCLNVYYIFSNRGKSEYSGIGNLPWSGLNSIILLGTCGQGSLTHEVGHFFGLFHTFDESDYVDDTPQVVLPDGVDLVKFLGKKETDPCYNNIMTYYDNAFESSFTPGQLKRMKHFILKQPRSALLMEEYEGYPLEIEISQRYLNFIDRINEDILRNPQVPVVCQNELTEILIRIGFLSPLQPALLPPPSN